MFFLIPFFLSLIATPVIRAIAIKNNLIAYPRADRWHKKPTAILGGIAIYLASIISFFLFGNLNRAVAGLAIGGTFLFIIGLTDDKFHFPPYIKLFTQIIAGSIAIFCGITFGLSNNAIIYIPLTLLWIVGITNSFNLLDNIDGLAAGIATISSIMLFFSAQIFANNQLGIYGLILGGAALGFLPYNFNPAKIFMGDSGSMFLGYCLAVISLAGVTRHVSNLFITMLLPMLILTVPIFDTSFVMILRAIQGRKIFKGGKDHTSHHLVTLGLSQRKTVLLLYSISIAFSSIALLYSRLNAFIISVITFLAVIVLLFFGFFLTEGASAKTGRIKAEKQKTLEDKTILNSIFLHKRRIVEVLLDFALICVAYYSAYFLRFEGELFSRNSYLIENSLIWIILIKMSVFFIFGLYRGVWKYISISDLLTIFKVVSISSIVSILFITFAFRFQEYSRAVFFIDWILLLCLISGVRVIFRVLGEFFSRAREKGNNILIFGAGDTGEMVVREIKRNKQLNYNPIGFLDDDLEKLGNKIHGISVLGSRSDIKDLSREYTIKEVIIAIPSIDLYEFSQIAQICKECGLTYRKVVGLLDNQEEKIDLTKNRLN
ncbi:MAG: hypothetical protein PHT31_01005 [Candidatus Omnitrophica bacterium]|nr:hypothetical protein [Candidatus Omnitrophota bacterium]